MNRSVIILAALTCGLSVTGLAQSTGQQASLRAPLSSAEAKNLMKSAHTTAEYKKLAVYFHEREADFNQRAAAEKVERDRRAQVNAGVYQKYPRPVDSAEALYESYVADANAASIQAKHYDELAMASQAATPPQGRL